MSKNLQHDLLDGKLTDRLSTTRKSDPPTAQDRQNGLNLITKNTPPDIMTIDPNNNDGVKFAQEVHRINDAKKDPEADWRNELADLERQLTGASTEQEAKQHADAIEREHNETIKGIEGTIKELRELLKTPHLTVHTGWNGAIRMRSSREEKLAGSGQLCGCDGCVLLIKIEKLEDALQTAKKQRERAIRISGSQVASSKDRDKLRPRYRELKRREHEVDAATSKIRSIDGVGGVLGQERLTHSDRLGYTGLKPL